MYSSVLFRYCFMLSVSCSINGSDQRCLLNPARSDELYILNEKKTRLAGLDVFVFSTVFLQDVNFL